MTGTERRGEERRGDEAGGKRGRAELCTAASPCCSTLMGQPGPDGARRAGRIPWRTVADTPPRSRQESINRRRLREKKRGRRGEGGATSMAR